MARKKEKTTLEKGTEAAQQAPVSNPTIQIRQDIANLCTSIGDRSFVIRQANSDITSFYAQIDQLRDKLRALEQPNGSQAAK